MPEQSESDTLDFESSNLSDTNNDDTATSPPELFTARVQRQVLQPLHAQVQVIPADACMLIFLQTAELLFVSQVAAAPAANAALVTVAAAEATKPACPVSTPSSGSRGTTGTASTTRYCLSAGIPGRRVLVSLRAAAKTYCCNRGLTLT
jgi:hypothetical protein